MHAQAWAQVVVSMSADLEAKREQKVSNHQIFVNWHAASGVFGPDTAVWKLLLPVRMRGG
jgi:hypothetical protein